MCSVVAMAGERAQMATARALAALNSQGEGSSFDPAQQLFASLSSGDSITGLPSKRAKRASARPPRRAAAAAAPAPAAAPPLPPPAAVEPPPPPPPPEAEEGPAPGVSDEAKEVSPRDHNAAAREALNLNLKLQAALREQLQSVDDALGQNRDVLKVIFRQIMI